MFVQDFMIVDRPCGDLVGELEARAGTLFRDAVGEARADLDRLRVKVGPEVWPVPLARTVEVTLGPARQHGDVTVLPFAWHATGAGSLFPVLDADLEVSPLGEGRSEIALRGRYDSPGGTPGRKVDQFLRYRLANATVRAFLSRLTGQLAVPQATA